VSSCDGPSTWARSLPRTAIITSALHGTALQVRHCCFTLLPAHSIQPCCFLQLAEQEAAPSAPRPSRAEAGAGQEAADAALAHIFEQLQAVSWLGGSRLRFESTSPNQWARVCSSAGGKCA